MQVHDQECQRNDTFGRYGKLRHDSAKTVMSASRFKIFNLHTKIASLIESIPAQQIEKGESVDDRYRIIGSKFSRSLDLSTYYRTNIWLIYTDDPVINTLGTQ